MEEVKQKTQEELLKDAEVGKAGFEIEETTPMEFRANKKEMTLMSTELEEMIGSYFKTICDDTAMVLIKLNNVGKLVCEVFLQNNKFTANQVGKQFKAVIPHEVKARVGNTVDNLKLMNASKNGVLALTDDGKLVFEEFVCGEARRNVGNGKIVIDWNQVYSERPFYQDVFGMGMKANTVYSYGVVVLDPVRLIAKLYGEKNEKGTFYQYVVEGVVVKGYKQTPKGERVPIFQMKVSQFDRDIVNEDFAKVNPVSGNIFGATLASIR